jgi:hypothetical protein
LRSWKDNIKGLGNFAAKALATGAKNVINATQEQIKESNRKREIVDKMGAGTIKELARQRGIRPEGSFGESPTIDDYKDSLVSEISLKDLIEFAKKKRIDIRDILDSISKDEAKKEQKQLEENTNVSADFKEIANCIREFKPLSNYNNEYPYQAELTQWLKSRFPNTGIEIQRGSSRPDIVVNGVGIEVKGPTFDKDLVTIFDKLGRYPQWFPKGIIIVLFRVNVYPSRYDEWRNSIKNTQFHGLTNIEIIRI